LTEAVDAGLELLTVGRVSVDLYAEEPGLDWNDVSHFVKSVGGSPTNVAVAAARLGHRAAVFTKVGADPFGAYVRAKLASFGVDTRFVGTHPTLRTPLAFAVLDPPDDPPILFYRQPNAPDFTITLDEIALDVVATVPIFWVTGTAVAAEPTRTTTMAMLATRDQRRHTVVDLDYRAMFWPSLADARAAIGAMVDHATVAVGNRTECDVAIGTGDPNEAADRLLQRGVEIAVVKMGGEGVLVATEAHRAVVPPVPVEVVCGLGAGDAFGGALCHGLLSGWEPERSVVYANAAGAIVASRLLCSDAMPTTAEVDSVVEASHAAR
jgi:5-dehydro-2-deoxygluconokinase